MSTDLFDLSQPALVVWLLKATALLVLALAATTLLRRASAGARHLVWLATLAGVLALPALSFWSPVHLSILPNRLTTSSAVPATSPITAVPKEGVVDAALPSGRAPAVVNPAPVARHENQRPAGDVADKPLFPVGPTVVVIWLALTAALLAWLASGALSVRGIVRRSRPLDDAAWTRALCDIADRLDLDAVPRLVASDRVEMPFACGILTPTIVLPASADAWTDDRRRAVLFHELAHVKRRDLVGHTLGRIACALYWFHPLVWTAARRLRAESERACDDLVLSCGARASDYADHLLDLVIGARRQGAPATAMPMARRRELEGRVLAILDPAVRRVAPGRLQSAGLIGVLALLAISVAAMAPAPHPPQAIAGPSATDQHPSSSAVATPPSAAVPRQNGDSAAPTAPRNPQIAAAESSGADISSVPRQAAIASRDSIDRQSVARVAAALVGTQEEGAHVKPTPEAPPIDTARVRLLARVLRTDTDASVRRTAAWGLSEAGGFSEALDALIEALRRDDNDSVREMAAWALAGSRRETVQRALAEAVRRDTAKEVRETAAWALADGGGRGFEETFVAALADVESEVRETAAWALGQLGQRPAPRALIAALSDREPEVRETAAWALAEIEDSDTGPGLLEAFLKETNSEVKLAELRALSFVGMEDRKVLDAALASKDADLRARAVRMLAGAGGAWPEPRPRPRPRPSP